MIDGKVALASFGLSESVVERLTGGDINLVYRLDNSVLKLNSASNFPGMLRLEADALRLLGEHVKTPDVIDNKENDSFQLLELEYIESGPKTSNFWDDFGKDLAQLHDQSTNSFGLSEDNYIGSLKQSNRKHEDWNSFLIQERLQPMIEMAVNNGDVNYVESKVFDGFYARVGEIYPKEKPALIHGDLWGGNYICSSKGEPVLIDPAIYYGHREMDIGMMHLFGGFDSILFESYNAARALEAGWKGRIKYSQLYPLLVHVNLFGRSYWSQVHNIVKEFA